MFLKISQNSWENTCARVSFLNKVFFIKKETVTQLFSCEFCEISKNTFTHGTPLDEVHDIPNQIKNFLSFWGQKMKNVKSARYFARHWILQNWRKYSQVCFLQNDHQAYHTNVSLNAFVQSIILFIVYYYYYYYYFSQNQNLDSIKCLKILIVNYIKLF